MRNLAIAFVVGLILFSGIQFSGKTVDEFFQPVFNAEYDWEQLGRRGDPNYSLLKRNRMDRREAVRQMREHLDRDASDPRGKHDAHGYIGIRDPLAGGTTPHAYYEGRRRAAELAHDFTVEENRLRADLEGTHLPANPDAIVEANEEGWQTVYCLNVSTGRQEPCKFFAGERIEAWGTIRSIAVTQSDRPMTIGTCGLSDDDPQSTPFIADLPRFALIGRIAYESGGYSEPFRICGSATIPAEGILQARPNHDYRDRFGRTHGEWIEKENSGSFKLRRIN